MKKFRMLICLFFSLGMLSIIIPGYGDSHCDGNPQGCAIAPLLRLIML